VTELDAGYVLRVVLIDTAAPDRPNGSMVRYGQMVQEALKAVPGGAVQVSRVQLAPRQAILSRWPVRLQTLLRYLWIVWQALRQLPRQRDGVLHLLDGSHAYLLSACPRLRVPLVITVHDLIPLLTVHGALGGQRPGLFGQTVIKCAARNLRRADRILADSDNTARDCIHLVGLEMEQIQVVHPPLPASINACAIAAGDAPYVLHVAGNNTFYKNRVGVVEIFKLVREQEPVRLKMVGAPPTEELLTKVKELGLADAVDFVSNVSDVELAGYYRGAAVFLFPSLYEGFGWPPLEAMQQGCPVVCSKAGSLAEIVGDAAVLIDPGDHDGFANVIIDLLRDSEAGTKYIELGYQRLPSFSGLRFSQKLSEQYKEISKVVV